MNRNHWRNETEMPGAIWSEVSRYLKSLENLVIGRILTERQLHGKFRSFDDFIDRVAISQEQLTILIRIDAFRFTGISKKELL